jgi:hypothetical protein
MPERHGLLLVNLGTPASTRLPDIKAFLREFLMDGRVITLAWPLRWLLVNGFIVPRRAPLSQRKYQRIWTAQGSPLLVHNQAFVARLQELLGPGTQVELAMRYGQPGMAAALDRLQGVARLSVLPLFPQYAEATTGSVYALLDRLLKARPGLATLRAGFLAAGGLFAGLQPQPAPRWRFGHGRSCALLLSRFAPARCAAPPGLPGGRCLLRRAQALLLPLPMRGHGPRPGPAPGAQARGLELVLPVPPGPGGMVQALHP